MSVLAGTSVEEELVVPIRLYWWGHLYLPSTQWSSRDSYNQAKITNLISNIGNRLLERGRIRSLRDLFYRLDCSTWPPTRMIRKIWTQLARNQSSSSHFKEILACHTLLLLSLFIQIRASRFRVIVKRIGRMLWIDNRRHSSTHPTFMSSLSHPI